jgi:hypothetical protein
MNVETFIRIEYTGKNGRRYTRTRKAHSLVRAFIDILYAHLSQVATTTSLDTGNVSQTLTLVTSNFAANAAASTNTQGIVVGTGTGAVSVTDYQLGTIIAHGTGATQLQYGAQSSIEPATVGTTRTCTLSRTFANNSGGDITVKEVGLIVKAATSYYFLIDRTLNEFTIINGTSATVSYLIKVTVA